MTLGEKRAAAAWLWAAAALAGSLLLLLAADTAVWHAGYAHGDETDIIARVQRVREGMPLGWNLSQGSIFRVLLLGSMSLWPGQLWATSAPAIAGLALEALLLFVIGRRLGGPRAGFFAVLAGMASAFTLVRGRVALSLCLFPAEWLALVWLRFHTKTPWQWALWGCALGLLCFDYEAWLPTTVLFLVIPFAAPVPFEQRCWELLGAAALLLALLPLSELAHYIVRRRQASFAQTGSPSAGWQGLKGLVFGGKTLPYMAPTGHGILPFWYWLLLPLGLVHWGKRAWVPLVYLAMGLVLPLMGGAPYGLPAHRAIAAWPALALITGLAMDRLAASVQSKPGRLLLAGAATLVLAQQLLAWQQNQAWMDAQFRVRVRDLKRAADMAWDHSRSTGFPLVTELHPMLGAQFRFLTGHAVAMPDAKAATVVAFLPWEYLPAVRKNYGQVATFQEQAGSPPAMVGVLNGRLASLTLEAEWAYRPLLIRYPQYTPASSDLVFDWLRQHPQAGPWARTLALDYVGVADWHAVRIGPEWLGDVWRQELASARPLILAGTLLEQTAPQHGLDFAHKARLLDPFNAESWMLEQRLLDRLGRKKESLALEKAKVAYTDHGLAFHD